MTKQLWQVVFLAAILVSVAALAHHHWLIISAPVPLDLYEGTMPLITSLISAGHNPYTLEFQPQAANVYPPLYNIVVAPLTWWFDNSFQLHRSVSGIFILLSATLAGIATWKSCKSWLHATAAATLLYAALIFYGTPVASTNAIGVALFLASVILPWLYGFSNKSLVVALVCGLLAFYAKQYFILGVAILCIYMFVYVSMSRAIVLAGSFAGALITSLAIVHTTSPYYLDNTLFAPSAAVIGLARWSTLFMQLKVFISIYGGLLLAALAANWAVFQTGSHPKHSRWATFSFKGLSAPLLNTRGNYFYFSLAISALAVVFSFGRNPGNFMTYLFQLMSPFLVIACMSSIEQLQGKYLGFTPLVLLTFWQAYAILPKDFSTNLENWQAMEAIIAEEDTIFATQMLVMALLRQGKTVHQDGYTFYFPLAVNKPRAFVKRKETERISTIWKNYIETLYRDIEQKKYDLILISKWEMHGVFQYNPPPFSNLDGRSFLKKYYAVDDKIELSMTDRYGGGTYLIYVWRPRDE